MLFKKITVTYVLTYAEPYDENYAVIETYASYKYACKAAKHYKHNAPKGYRWYSIKKVTRTKGLFTKERVETKRLIDWCEGYDR